MSTIYQSSDEEPRQPAREVMWFARCMQRELDANRHKGDWRRAPMSFLLSELSWHLARLTKATDAGSDRETIIHEAADSANFLMMIADVVASRDPRRMGAGSPDGPEIS